MALTATIFKAELQISDMDRNYYAEHLLTLARHPSETDERMMVRLLAFALNADEHLSFTKGMGDRRTRGGRSKRPKCRPPLHTNSFRFLWALP